MTICHILSKSPWLILSKQVDESDLLDFSGQLASLGDHQGYMLANIIDLIFFANFQTLFNMFKHFCKKLMTLTQYLGR